MTNKKEHKILRKTLSLTLAILVSILGIPLTEPQQVSATETSDSGYLTSISINASASSTWDKQYNTEFYKEIINNYNNYTAGNPLQINSADKLAAFAKVVNDTTGEAKGKDFSGKYVKLTDDIDLGGKNPTVTKMPSGDKFSISITGTASNVWVPIGNSAARFKGNFDGNGCEVRNMTVLITSGYVYAGLFGYVDGGSIKNTGVTGNVYASFSVGEGYVSGLVGECSGSITNSYAICNVYACSSSSFPTYAGGLTGENINGGITNSYATGNVYTFSSPKATPSAGGLVGYCASSITNSYATGNVYASSSSSSSHPIYASGLVGRGGSSISNSYATGNVLSYSSNSGTKSCASRLSGDSSVTNSYYYSGATIKGSEINFDNSYARSMDQMTGTGSGRADDTMKAGLSTSNWTFQADGIGIKYLPRLKNIRYNEATNPVPKFLVTINPVASYFDFKALSVVYDGQPKEATVTPKFAEIGKITKKYYDSSGKKLDGAPTNAGTYKVKIDVASNNRCNSATDITAENWNLIIEKATPKDDDFIYSPPDNLVYDGEEKIAQVIAGDSVKGQVGAIGVYYHYKNEDGKLISLDGPPRDVGNYVVDIYVEGGDNYKGAVVSNKEWTFSIGKDALEAADFDFTPPKDLIYNGDEKAATVTAKSGINGMGEITAIRYYKDGKEVTPINAGEYTVEIDVEAGTNYGKATLTSTNWKFTIEKAKVANKDTPTVAKISYGTTLNLIKLPDGWKWLGDKLDSPTDPSKIYPTVVNTGYYAYYEANDTDNYDWSGVTYYNSEKKRVERLVAVTVTPSDPTATELNAEMSVSYRKGQKLGDVALPSGWIWQNSTKELGDAGTEITATAVFVPLTEEGDLDTNYNTLKKEIKVTVEQADPTYTPIILTATYGDTLKSVGVPKQLETETPGTWKWVNPTTSVGDAGENKFEIKFTPNDATNYKEVIIELTVIVKKATPKAGDFDFTPPKDLIYNGEEKAATVTAKSGINGMGKITAIKYYKDGKEVTPTNAGEYTVKIDVVEGDNYNAATLGGTNWKFTTNKAPVEVLETPELSAITYSKDFTLGKIKLIDGWKWEDSSIIPTVKNEGYVAYYEVKDDDNYDWSGIYGYEERSHIVKRTVGLTVNPAKPTIPSGLVGIFGQALKDVTIPQVEEEGTWSWDNKDTKLSSIGKHSYEATFTSAENGNYSTKPTKLEVTVERKPINSKDIKISFNENKESYEYDGTPGSIQPKITVTDGDQELKEGKDYEVSYNSVSWPNGSGKIKGKVIVIGKGNYCESNSATFTIIDKNAPTGMISVDADKELNFSIFNSDVRFLYMFNKAKTVRIQGSDSETGIGNIYYYISDENLFPAKNNGEAYTNKEIEDKISSKGWNLYDKNKAIELTTGTKNIIYAKIVDNSGNVRYVNSQGIIVYNIVKGATEGLTYTRTTNSDVTIITSLDENNKEEIRQGNTVLIKDQDYTVSGSEVKLKGSYLETLPAGSYSFTVSYKPFGENFYEGDFPKDVTVDVKVIRSGLSEDNFNFTPPEDPTYNGEAKEATVTSKPEFKGIGKINIKYYDISDPDASERELSGAPINPGTYKVKISVDQSDKYDSAEITDDNWTFKVEYLEPGNNPYKITISENDYKKDDSNYWLKDNNVATISPTGKDYKISTEPGKGYTSELEVSSWTPGTAIYLRDDDGHMTGAIKVNVNISQDKNSPTGSITIKDRTPWESLINVITFGLFFKEEQTATITASDGESGIQEAKYLVSNSDLIQNENEQNKEIKTKLDNQEGWESFTGDPKKDVTLEKDNKYVVYEKITDNVGHVTYVSSNGIVIYTDSQAEESEIEYVKETEEDLKLKIFPKENTIKDIEVKDEKGVKRKVKYKVSEEDANKSSTITFPWGDLNKLEFGNYTVTITYNPQGVEYNGTGDEPTDSIVNLKVVKNPTVTIDKFDFTPPGDPIYDGKPKEAKVTVKEGVNGVGEITIKYYDSKGTPLEGSPTDVGEYVVKIDVTEGTSYGEVKNLTAENWNFKIKQAFPENPVTPTIKAVKYGTKLSEITLDDGWNWVDGTITTTVENQGYVAYYDVEDDTNYDWSNIEGYNAELHRVERTLKLTVFVDKSDWGEEVKNNDELNYVDKDGTTSTEVVKKDVTWVKEESDGTSAWYGVDNSEGEFELGSRFWVRWLNKEKDKEEWEYYYNNLDEKHKNAVDSGRLWIFLAGVTAPNGQEYKEFNKEVKFYIQLGEDWDKEDINSVFISSGEDEIVDVSYADSMSCPEGKKEFAILTLKHFSPYAVYDNLTDEERAALMESGNRNEANSDNDNVMYRVWGLFTTGDTATPLILTGLAVLVIASGATLIFLKKKRKK